MKGKGGGHSSVEIKSLKERIQSLEAALGEARAETAEKVEEGQQFRAEIGLVKQQVHDVTTAFKAAEVSWARRQRQLEENMEEYKDKLMDHDVMTTLAKDDVVLAVKAELETVKQERDAAREELKAKLVEAIKVPDLEAELQTTRSELTLARERVARMEKELATAKDEAQFAKTEAKDWKERFGLKEAELETLRGGGQPVMTGMTAGGLSHELKALDTKLAKMMDNFAKERRQMSDDVQQAEEKNVALQDRLVKTNAIVAQLRKDVETLQGRVSTETAALEAKERAMRNMADEHATEVNELKDKIGRLETEKVSLEEISNAKRDDAAELVRLRQMERDFASKLETNDSHASRQITRLRLHVEELTAKLDSLSGELTRTQAKERDFSAANAALASELKRLSRAGRLRMPGQMQDKALTAKFVRELDTLCQLVGVHEERARDDGGADKANGKRKDGPPGASPLSSGTSSSPRARQGGSSARTMRASLGGTRGRGALGNSRGRSDGRLPPIKTREVTIDDPDGEAILRASDDVLG